MYHGEKRRNSLQQFIPLVTANVEPQLNPIHPHHKKKVPRITLVGLDIANGSFSCNENRPRRAPRNKAATNAAAPPVMCTTDAPAKSKAPFLASQPCSSHIQWAGMEYVKVA